jgi:hypothetical protein
MYGLLIVGAAFVGFLVLFLAMKMSGKPECSFCNHAIDSTSPSDGSCVECFYSRAAPTAEVG